MTELNIPQSLEHLFPEADPMTSWQVRDDGKGQYIAEWHLKADKPTAEEIAQAWEAVKNKYSREAIQTKEQLFNLEQSITPRRMREAVLSEEGKTWLDGVENQIAKLREKLNG